MVYVYSCGQVNLIGIAACVTFLAWIMIELTPQCDLGCNSDHQTPDTPWAVSWAWSCLLPVIYSCIITCPLSLIIDPPASSLSTSLICPIPIFDSLIPNFKQSQLLVVWSPFTLLRYVLPSICIYQIKQTPLTCLIYFNWGIKLLYTYGSVE